MASLLITKANDKLNTVVTINGKGVFYQELRLGDRPMSARVKLGKLVVVDDEIMVDYSEWTAYDSLLVSRDTKEKTRSAAKSVLEILKKDNNAEAIALKSAEVESLTGEIARLENEITKNPIHDLAALSAKVMADVDKMLDKVRFKHQHLELTDKTVAFTHSPNREYFLQRQAEDLIKKHNEWLESRDIQEGYLDWDQAIAIIEKRFAPKKAEVKPAKTPVNPTAIVDTIIKSYESALNKVQFLNGLDKDQFNGLCQHFKVTGRSKSAKVAELVKAMAPTKV